jgi:hypothetical protein
MNFLLVSMALFLQIKGAGSKGPQIVSGIQTHIPILPAAGFGLAPLSRHGFNPCIKA